MAKKIKSWTKALGKCNDLSINSIPDNPKELNWNQIVNHEIISSNSNQWTNYKITMKNGSYFVFSTNVDVPNLIGKTFILHKDGVEIK
jgi:hypothetical protein